MNMKLTAMICTLALLAGLLAGCGGAASDAAPAAEEVPAAEPAPEESGHEGSGTDKVAGAEDMTTVEDVTEEGMTPVYAADIRDGVYEIEMKSSSSMFKVERCELTVAGDEMTAALYMTSDAYAYMFAGTAAEAAEADTEDYILLAEDDSGERFFTLPVEALDAGLSYAAFSVRKELWYDRTLLFRADSLPLDAFAEQPYTDVSALGLAAGTYTAEVSLTGGSGKAGVASPATLTVSGDGCTARLEWSSSKYDYMVVDGEKYTPVNTEGNSVFEIPVAFFDYPMPVLADTTAMSTPHEIEYTLYFDSATLTPAA